jgi:hypothetical protein
MAKEDTKMRKLVVFLPLSCLIMCTFLSSALALLPYFTPTFDRIDYYLGSTGAVKVEIATNDQAFDIREIGFQLYFPRTDGTDFVTQLFEENYGDTPLQIPAYDTANVTVEFTIPQRNDLISGPFYYVFNVTLREQGTDIYSEVPTERLPAQLGDNNCVLIASEATPSPTPTTSPTPTPSSIPTPTPSTTPTPTPTTTPTPTPTPTPIDFFSLEVLYGIAIVVATVMIIIILVMLKKRKK